MKLQQITTKLALLGLFTLLVISCKDDDSGPAPITANFANMMQDFNEGDTLNVSITLSAEVTEAQTLIINWSSQDAGYDEDFATFPESSQGTLSLDVEPGFTTVFFTLAVRDDEVIDGDKTLNFSIAESNEQFEVGTINASTSISLIDNDVVDIRINEFHYDNSGTDSNEFVEIAVKGGIDIPNLPNNLANLSDYRVILYNGNDGMYVTPGDLAASSETLDNMARDGDCFINGCGFYYVWEPAGGIQNGTPDGIALTGPEGLIQFISFEGTFTGAEGVATGVTSTDVLVEEGADTPEGSSIQYTRAGDWEIMAGTNTKGIRNINE